MGRFEAVNGLVHLTFANEDVYYKNSLVRLNLQQNLYYELKQKDYEAVCFVVFENGKFLVRFGNDHTAALYHQNSGGAFGKFLKALVATDDNDVPKALEYDQMSEEFLNRILSMMKREKNVAVVFTMEAMAAIQNKAKVEEGFLEVSRNNYNKNNLLLIVVPTVVEGSRAHFENENGIFRTDLFPAIKKIFQNYENVHFYERLKIEMPNRISYMNEYNLNVLRNLVTYAIMKNGFEVTFLPRDYADCIWFIYNSVTFRNWVEDQLGMRERFKFPLSPQRKYSEIEKIAQDEKMYTILDQVILKIREHSTSSERLYKMIPSVLHLNDYEKEDQQYLFWNNDLAQRIDKIYFGWIKNIDVRMDAQKKITRIRRCLNTPYICASAGEDNLRETYMGEYIDDAMEATVKKDRETFVAAIEAMYHIVCRCEEDTQKSIDRETEREKNNIKKTSMAGYRNILECQKNVFELRQDLNRDHRIYMIENEEISKIRGEIERIEKEYPDIRKLQQIYLSETGASKEKPLILTEYINKKKLVNDKWKSLKSKKLLIEKKQNEITHMENMIRNIETTISGLSLTKGAALQAEMNTALEYMQSVYARVNSMQKKWTTMSSALDKVQEEAWDQSEEYRIEDFGMDLTLEEFERNEELYEELL